MKVLRLHARGDLRLHEESEPAAREGDALVRVTAVGLCGSDRLWLAEGGIGDSLLERPLVLGHEIAGVIETGSRSGERVVLDPAIPCGHCTTCLAGNQHLCPEVRFAGHGHTDGALRSLMAWPEELAYRVPDSLSDPEATLLEPMGVALHALDLAKTEPGMSAGVFGSGPIGLLLVQLLAMVGATEIVATDRLPHRIAAAREMGATIALDAEDLEKEEGAPIDRLTGERGLDVAFEVAGEDDALEDAIASLRPGGRLVEVGIPAGDRTSFTASAARRKGLTIALCRRMKSSDLPRAVRLVERGMVKLAPLVSGCYPLSNWADAFSEFGERRSLKVVIEPQHQTTGDAA